MPKWGWLNVTLYSTKIVLRQLDRGGVFDPIKKSPFALQLGGYVASVSQTLGGGEAGLLRDRGWFESLKNRFVGP